MTTWNIESLVHVINLSRLEQSITETPFDELVTVYGALTKAVDVFLNCADIPEVTYIVSDLANAYAVEITNRLME